MPRCKNCGCKFEPRFTTLEKYCWEPACKTIEALQKLNAVKTQNEKQEKKDWAARKKKMTNSLMRKQDYEKILEALVNKYVRLRDAQRPCISCQAPAGSYTMSAGHFYPAGSYKNLRFNLDNIHGQCWYNCNKQQHGNLHEYRKHLKNRIGPEKLLRLDEMAKHEAHFTIPEIQDMITEFKLKIKELEKK